MKPAARSASELMLGFAIIIVLAMVLGGCVSTNYVPVPMQRQLPKQPVDCDPKNDPPFPRVKRPAPGQTLTPAETAAWAMQTRRWARDVRARRVICGQYTKRLQSWR